MNARARHTWAALTDIGLVRTHNEDSLLAQPPLFVVADGLGGHQAGEVASLIAVETLRDHAPKRPDAKGLAKAVRAANREVMRAAREGHGRAGMGTTMTAAIVEGTRIAIAQVGDSRAYLLHDDVLERLTEDHSMVADLIRRGQLTEAESRYHPNRSVITRALGTDANMDADAYEIEASPGDRLLLCSDGLTSMVEDPAIAGILASYPAASAAARALVNAANAAGGQDNISVIVVDIAPERSGQNAAPAAAPVKEKRRRGRGWLSALTWFLLFAIIVAGIGYASYRTAQSRAYLISENGVVVIYRGVPGSFVGIQLSWRSEVTTIPVSALPDKTSERLRQGLEVDSLETAQKLAETYRADVASTTATTP
ncbi:MAG: Stp1/IreP family PP2C-type Ser/Thr phosphatase [Coriobacteriia bacterium]